jgi:hypothetical protein
MAPGELQLLGFRRIQKTGTNRTHHSCLRDGNDRIILPPFITDIFSRSQILMFEAASVQMWNLKLNQGGKPG